MKEEHNARRQQKSAAAAAVQDRIAKQKAEADAKNRDKVQKADTDRLHILEAAEKEFQTRFNHFQAGPITPFIQRDSS